MQLLQAYFVFEMFYYYTQHVNVMAVCELRRRKKYENKVCDLYFYIDFLCRKALP